MALLVRRGKLFGALLLVGLVATSVMMLTIAEVHEHIYGVKLMRRDNRIQTDVHDDTTRRTTEAMFVLTWIGSPIALSAAIPVIAALLWSRGLRHAARICENNRSQQSRRLTEELDRDQIRQIQRRLTAQLNICKTEKTILETLRSPSPD